MTNEQAKDLLDRYNLGKCTEGEKALLEKWYMELGEDESIDISLERIEQFKYEVLKRLPVGARPVARVKLWQGAVAIAAMVLLTLGTWQLFFGFADKPQGLVVAEVKAGGNMAMLTVSGGRQIALDGRGDGVVVGTDSVSYMGGGAGVALAAGRQVLSTPRGGQFKLVLTDGTKVWLNAASSISYPSSFSGLSERRVEVTGEVYFEVAHDGAVPFRVVSSGQVVEVLGTHFNVNGYGDEGRIVTTLSQGSVRVLDLGSKKTLLLRPGQRAIVSATGSGAMVEDADLETELAWKNGMLEFRDADLRSILRTVSRWYDIDIEYRGEIAPRSFTGSVPRNSDLSVLLRILEYSKVHFKIEHGAGSPGRKLVVMP